MMQVNLTAMAEKGYLTESDVLNLRREIFTEVQITDDELNLAFELAALAPQGGIEWQMLFCEICSDYFLISAAGQYYFDETTVEMLKKRFDPDHKASNALETMALIHLIRKASETPHSIALIVKNTMRSQIAKGTEIDVDDVDLIRSWLHARGSEDAMGVSRAEADFLFEINDQFRDGRNDPTWTELFMKAIANHIMTKRGYLPPSRKEALRRDRWLNDTSTNIGGFLGGLLSGMSLSSLANRDREVVWGVPASEIGADERLRSSEIEWLAKRIAQDGVVCEAEKALVAYVRELCGVEIPIANDEMAQVA